MRPKMIPSRTTRPEVPRDRRWEINAVLEIELEKISSWLKDEANTKFGALRDKERTLQAGSALPEQVQALFGAEDVAIDPQILDDASTGKLGRQAPAASGIAMASVLKWVFLCAEVLIFTFLYLAHLANWLVILVGGLLAVGGYLTGLGGGTLIVAHESKGSLRSVRGWVCLIVGLIIVGGIAYARTGGEEEGAFPVVAVTVGMALAIAVLEIMEMLMRRKYRELWEKMYSAQ